MKGRYHFVIIGEGTAADAAMESILRMQPEAEILCLSDEIVRAWLRVVDLRACPGVSVLRPTRLSLRFVHPPLALPRVCREECLAQPLSKVSYDRIMACMWVCLACVWHGV